MSENRHSLNCRISKIKLTSQIHCCKGRHRRADDLIKSKRIDKLIKAERIDDLIKAERTDYLIKAERTDDLIET